MLSYEQIAGYLHYYASKYQSNEFQHWELVNEAWIRNQDLRRMDFASSAIRWSMLHYMKKQRSVNHLGKKSTDGETQFPGIFIKDIVLAPKDDKKMENLDSLKGILAKVSLTYEEKDMVEKYYFKNWSQTKLAKSRHCTPANICLKLGKIISRMNRACTYE